jgi:hypothetical protein
MENVIISIENVPDGNSFKAFKDAVGRIVKENEGDPIELNKTSGELFVRLPKDKIDRTKSQIAALRL